MDQVDAVVVVEDAWTPATLGTVLARGAAAVGVRTGACTRAEAAGWLADLEAASAEGRYLFSVNDYLVVATKAGATPGR